MRKAAAAYQEQHKLSRGNVTVLYLQRGRNHLGDRHVRFYPDIVFKWDWTLCHVVISLHICNSSRCIDDSRLSKEVIGEQIKAPDSSTLEGRVREVGFDLLADYLLDRKSTRLNSSHQIISYAV